MNTPLTTDPIAPTHRRRRYRSLIVSLALLSALATLAIAWVHHHLRSGRNWDASQPPIRFVSGLINAPSPMLRLQHTQIVPTLDTPLRDGQNAIWCATFQLAWKHLQQANNGSMLLDGAVETCDRLNAAADPTSDLPAGEFYANGGLANPAQLAQIRTDVTRQFGNLISPDLADALPNTPFAYACMRTSLEFDIPYFDSDDPLWFNSQPNIRGTPVRAFGIRGKDADAYPQLHAQPRVLFCDVPPLGGIPTEFAIDLCQTSKPNQLIVACLPRQATLQATLALLNDRIVAAKPPAFTTTFHDNDELLVPNLHFAISHAFAELTGRRSTSGPAVNLPLIAHQDIAFRLDRSGVELTSESAQKFAAAPICYMVNGPFLIVMKRRDATNPFLILWIENCELLQRHEP